MKILVVGGGGREHATIKSLVGEGREIFCAPGNGGIGALATNVPIKATDIEGMVDFCKKENVAIGVLTVPKEAAYEVCRVLIDAGVKGIWNFANTELKFPENNVIVENIHLGDSLMKLCYEIKTKDEENENK